MATPPEGSSWFGPPDAVSQVWQAYPGDSAGFGGIGFLRLWRGFMAVRILTGVVLLGLQLVILGLGQTVPPWLIALALGYLLAAAAVQRRTLPALPVRTLDRQWMLTIGLDLLFFSALQLQQTGGINYTPLLALPVLLGAVLGTVLIGLGTAAAVTLLLLADAWWLSLLQPADAAARFLQAALTSTGLFIVAFLANQLASRLAGEEQRAAQNQRAARIQTLVNEVVIDNLTDGVLVVDSVSVARAANPAARLILGVGDQSLHVPFSLRRDPAWQAVADLAMLTFEQRSGQFADLAIEPPGLAPLRVRVRTRITPTLADSESLCVIFMQDLREMEARVRTEKLAAMGRMSAAVAHEIRNPLAAIAQANALLEEDVIDPAQRKLTQMVAQNAQRLSRMVEEVLDLARVQQGGAPAPTHTLVLDDVVDSATGDWMRQTGNGPRVRLALQAPGLTVAFGAEHLRRILVNLLDNAARYARPRPDAIVITTHPSPDGRGMLQVWSDGAPLEQAVQRHLFEPFFSSESRSSGLGLYICRELCGRHGATIGYERAHRAQDGHEAEGNTFFVVFRPPGAFDTMAA